MSAYCTRSHPHEQMDDCCHLMTEIARLNNRIALLENVAEAYREYHNLLQAELTETFSIAHNHGYRSSRIVEGQNARAKIVSTEQAAGYEVGK